MASTEIKTRVTDIAKLLRTDEDVASDAQSLMGDVISLLQTTALASTGDKATKYISRVGMVMSAGAVVKNCYNFWKRTRTVPESTTYFLKIDESDDLFDVIEAWAMEAMPRESQRSVLVFTDTDSDNKVRYHRNSRGRMVAEEESKPVTLGTAYDGSVLQTIKVRGFDVDIMVETPDVPDNKMTAQNYNSYRTITIACESLEAKDAVIEELSDITATMRRREPAFYTNAKWGGFNRRSSAIPHRPQESVILKSGQMDRILGFLNNFLENEKPYIDLGAPYHTGLLLHGNPGSGKTSTAKAIAYELGLDVYYIALSSIENDATLNSLMEDVPAKSVVILEDIDVASAVKEREDNGKGVTMQGVLNVLDGLMTPHGVIFIMTTNHKENLDNAIVRSGRVDLQEEVDELDTEQLRGICQYFMKRVPENLPEVSPEHRVTSADVIGILRSHIPNIENAEQELIEFVSRKVDSFTKS